MLVRGYLRTPIGRYNWDTRKLKLPIVGEIILKATLARFARSFALSSQSGVPLVQALTVVAQTVDNTFIGSRIEQMRDGIERGESISRCAAATGVFTPVVLQMISVGEETGELDNLLFEIAGMYERETDYNIKGLSAAIEPILLAIIAVSYTHLDVYKRQRLSTLPTNYGESAVMRLLKQGAGMKRLDDIGMPTEMLRRFREVLGRSSGLVLVTGPTGSGKTTTLYAALAEINAGELKVITVEDPVEYRLPGLTQVCLLYTSRCV